MIKPEIQSREQYEAERRVCDIAAAYWEEHATHGRAGSSMSAELAAAPEYAACTNEIRGRVEQYELLSNPAERMAAYIGSDGRSVTVWTGLPLGSARLVSSWKTPGSYVSGTMGAYRCTIAGREYAGRSAGAGMFIGLKETAASKRNRESI